jgi:serine/threonine-protein kinase
MYGMSTSDGSRPWPQLAALLDELLDMASDARVFRLAELRTQDPALAAEVASLLAAAERDLPCLDEPLGGLAAELLADPTGPGAEQGGRIGPWQLGRCLGRGGMGVVFEAGRADGQYERRVALKLLDRLDHGGDLGRRLENERRILARLDHPGIARLLEGGVTPGGNPWFAMELVDGSAITVHCDQRRLSVRQRVELFGEVCEAVASAHQHLVVHRDLKPSNILVATSGQVKLGDFGVAKLLDEPGRPAAALTRTGQRVLTPRYAAPEQVRGEVITTATDVYALGAVLFELLCGHGPHGDANSSEQEVEQAVLRDDPVPLSRIVTRPFHRRLPDGETVQVLPAAVGLDRRTSPRQLRRELGGDLSTIVGKAMSKRPSDRYRSVEALRDDLERWRDGRPVRAQRPTLSYRTRKYIRRHRLEIGVSGLVFLLLAGGLAGTAWQAREASRQARHAERARTLLVDMFLAADPSRSQGREVTVREVLDRGTAAIKAELADDPRLEAELLLTVGHVYYALGYYTHADSLLTVAYERTSAAFGPDAMETAHAADMLGTNLQELGRVDDAEHWFRHAYDIALRQGGPRHLETLTALSNLGGVARRRGDSAEAVRIYSEMLSISRLAFGPEYGDLDVDLSNLAVALGDAERLSEADSVHTLALELRLRRHGERHPLIAISLHNRAEVLSKLGRGAEAESLWTRSIRISGELHPEGHPDLALTLTSYASFLRDTGRLDEATTLLETAAAMHRRLNPVPSQELARTLNSLGTLAYSRGDLATAATRLQEALEAWQATLGIESPAALTTMNNLAVILHRAGRLAEARPLFEKVLATRLDLPDPAPLDLAFSRKGLGMLALDEGRPDLAEPLLREAIEGLKIRFDDSGPPMAEALLGLGECRLAADAIEEAESLFRRAQPALLAAYAPDHLLVQRVAADLAKSARLAAQPR